MAGRKGERCSMYVVEKGNRAVSDISELRDYYISLEKEMEYEQLSLF